MAFVSTSALDPGVRLLLSAARRSSLGHALLLTTRSEISAPFTKSIMDLVQGLACAAPLDEQAYCGQCDSCRLFFSRDAHEGAMAHPDVVILEPESMSRGYSVDQIRDLQRAFSLRRSISPQRVVWVGSAHLLSVQGGAAGNALLKLLEEPRPDTFLILSSDKVDSVMPTLRSRCHLFRLGFAAATPAENAGWEPSWEPLRAWLSAGGAGVGPAFRLPADEEMFWKDRDKAILEMGLLLDRSWHLARSSWNQWPLDQAWRVLDMLLGLEELIRTLKGHGSPLLQWLAFRSRVRLGY